MRHREISIVTTFIRTSVGGGDSKATKNIVTPVVGTIRTILGPGQASAPISCPMRGPLGQHTARRWADREKWFEGSQAPGM